MEEVAGRKEKTLILPRNGDWRKETSTKEGNGSKDDSIGFYVMC